jgi:hypothetical protein
VTAPIEFRAWPKTPRLFRDAIITEKIDGTNAAIGILELNEDTWVRGAEATPGAFMFIEAAGLAADAPYGLRYFALYAQSRKRLISPGKSTDNAGFAAWVADNAADLVRDLGPGLHYGEWWGHGINRGYGMTDGKKFFSLFNTHRYGGREFQTPDLRTVPVLHIGPFSTISAARWLDHLEEHGSVAAPGFMRPEGIVVFHSAAGQVFKATVENDEMPKGRSE